MKLIFTTVLKQVREGHDCVFAVIGAAAGSAPRKTGTVMAFFPDTAPIGTLGGGILEFKVTEYAKELLTKKVSSFHCPFYLREDAPDAIGMICGGDVTVHFYFIPAGDTEWMTLLTECIRKMDLCDGTVLGMYDDGTWKIIEKTAFNRSRDCLVCIPLVSGERAILFGAGHVSMALCPILHSVGFRVTVYDDRPEFVTAERFPDADVLISADFSTIQQHLTFRENDYAVVLTASHTYDYMVETILLPLSLAYIGVIGSHKKIELTRKKLLDAGFALERINSIHTPVGLKIKAITPAEIAVSITAEMILERANRREQSGLIPTAGCPMHE